MRHSSFRRLLALPLFALGSLVLAASGTAHAAPAPAGSEFVYYRLRADGAKQAFEVRVRPDGTGTSTIVEAKPEVSSFRLRPAELERLKGAIRAARFFQLPPKDPAGAPSRIDYLLRVALDGQHRELRYRLRPELEPVAEIMKKLIQQGRLLHMVDRPGGVVAVLGAIGDGPPEQVLLQPDTLREPLQRQVARLSSALTITQALQALARITPAGGWSQFVAAQVTSAAEPRRSHLLWALGQVGHGGVPDEHRRAILPLLARVFSSEYLSWAKSSKERHDAVYWIASDLGDLHYAPAIPTLAAAIRKLPVDESAVAATALSRMGPPAVDATLKLLGDPAVAVRRSAVVAAGSLLQQTDSPVLFPRGQEKERAAFRQRMESDVRPRLERLARQDPDSRVRSRATQALQRLHGGSR